MVRRLPCLRSAPSEIVAPSGMEKELEMKLVAPSQLEEGPSPSQSKEEGGMERQSGSGWGQKQETAKQRLCG